MAVGVSDQTARAWRSIPTSAALFVSIALIITFLAVSALMSTVVYRVFGVGPSQLPPLVSTDWDIHLADEEGVVVWGEGPGIRLEGDFQCNPDFEVGASIQFQRSIQYREAPEGDASVGVVPFDLTPAVRADSVCSAAPDRPFTVLWSNIPQMPHEYPAFAVITYSATVDGYQPATAQTEVFTILSGE